MSRNGRATSALVRARFELLSTRDTACSPLGLLNGPFALFCRFLSRGDPCAWSGISCFLGTLLVLLASFVMRFGTLPPSDGY